MYTGLKLQISGQSIQEFGQERDNREAFVQHNLNLSNKIQFSNNKVEKVKPSKNVLLRHIPNDVLFQKQNQIHEMNKVAQKYRIPFTPDEDEKLKHLANKYGTRSWSLISTYLEGRTPKQCRDRYSNYLFPGFFKGEWTNEEDCLLFKLYNEFGPKWSKIKKSFPDRSSNSIKNRWYYFLRKNNEFLPVDGYKNEDSVEEGNITQTTNKIDVQLDVFELINEGENNNKTSKSTLNEEFNYNIDNISNSDFNKSILSQDVKLNEEENIFILNNENKETSNDEWIVYN